MKSRLAAQHQSADRQMRIGGGLVVAGMILSAIAMSPALLGGHLSSLWWALSMLTGAGLLILITGLRRAAAARSSAVKAASSEGK